MYGALKLPEVRYAAFLYVKSSRISRVSLTVILLYREKSCLALLYTHRNTSEKFQKKVLKLRLL